MSHVSDTILVFSILEDEETRLADVNRVLEEAAGGQRFVINVADLDVFGYGKALQTPTFIAAFNYLDIDALVEGLRTIKWDHPAGVQLLVSDEHDEPSHYTQRYPCGPEVDRAKQNIQNVGD